MKWSLELQGVFQAQRLESGDFSFAQD
uniref:Uncharacterized protein n=1 Tax=Anguilla anguilla TaxID=7936 RepID=A0A0E9XQ97_ANGAN